MATTLPQPSPDHRTLPRKKRPPSARDQAIYLAYKTTGGSQAKLAADNHVSQRRISQIIQRVERWRANLIPAAAGELDSDQSQRLERWLEQQRLQCIYDSAMSAHANQATELTTTRHGNHDGKHFEDETTRQLPPNVQLLKVALRATSDLGKLNEKAAPLPPDPKDDHERYWNLVSLLRCMRRNAGQSLPDSYDETDFVKNWIDKLIGKETAEQPDIETEGTATISLHTDRPPSITYSAGSQDAQLAAVTQTFDDSSATTAFASELFEASDSDPPFSNASSASNASLRDKPEPTSTEPTETQLPQPTSGDGSPPTTTSTSLKKKSKAPEAPLSRCERWERHREKVAQHELAMHIGLPCLIEFDPNDGPLPKVPFRLDDFGYQPASFSSDEIFQENAAYLKKIAAEYPEANPPRRNYGIRTSQSPRSPIPGDAVSSPPIPPSISTSPS